LAMPRFRLEPRLEDVPLGEWLVRFLCGLLLALAGGWLLLWLAGYNPLLGYEALARGAFGSSRAIAATLNKAVPIALCATGIALASRAGLWNIGAEGQLYFGAFAATGVGLYLPQSTPAILAMPLFFAAALLAGAFWALLAALPRAYLGVSEILSSLMLTYISILWVDYLVIGPWVDRTAFSFPFSPPVVAGTQLGRIPWTGIHWGVVAAGLAVALLMVIDRGLRWGYELRVTGDAPRAALYGGISANAALITALVAAGALAGVAGAIEVSASTMRLQHGLSPGYGFMAILVTWLANAQPAGILLASVLYAGLLNGSFALQVSKVPPAIATILQAALLIGVLATLGLAKYRLRLVPGAETRP
jgi:general nucleoside transport system permease protein